MHAIIETTGMNVSCRLVNWHQSGSFASCVDMHIGLSLFVMLIQPGHYR